MIDARAVIHPTAKLASNVTVGPFSVIGAEVEIGEGTWVGPHVVIQGPTKIGKHNKIFQFASVGEDPQDKKYQGERTFLEVGDNNVVREYCTLNRGTVQGGGVTRIGDDNLFMANVHIAHDCQVKSHCIFANNTAIAGHVEVRNYAILSGFIGVHQFCKIGEHSFVSRAALVTKDIPPYMMVIGGDRTVTCGINTEGLKRHGFTEAALLALRRAYKILYRQGLTLKDAIVQLETLAAEQGELNLLLSFLREETERGIVA